YMLSVYGVPAPWVTLAPSVIVAPSGSIHVPLTLTSDAFTAAGDYGFAVTAVGDNGAMASVQGNLTLSGAPVVPDPASHGVVVTLTPAQATAGQGTPAHFVLRVTNTGSATDT